MHAQPPPNNVLALPNTETARAALTLITGVETPSIANHSVRSYLFARLAAHHLGLHDGRDYDDRLLFMACVLHDLGLADDGEHTQRFEVVGADRAATFLTDHRWNATDVDAVWEAIALHSSAHIAERRGPLCLLVREGVTLDFGGAIGPGLAPDAVSDHDAATIHDSYPRLQMAHALVEAICHHAAQHPASAPRFTLPGELLRERGNPPRQTQLERDALTSRWGS
ncbi:MULTISPECIES: HD domain-containing protein [Actinomycetes]|uniref:HD domain-containing protein n=1 Tax=Actinomycetes TaxID=1760 RepID=UPI0004C201EF|nr:MULTISPECIES: HD domain-containing protein [Actinomycetes]